VAEGSNERESAHAEAPVRSDAFARMLGPDWVEVEPGIYEHRPLRLTAPPATPSPPAPTALDEELLENLPTPPEPTERAPSSSQEEAASPWRWLDS
jgi:hypothetical protein